MKKVITGSLLVVLMSGCGMLAGPGFRVSHTLEAVRVDEQTTSQTVRTKSIPMRCLFVSCDAPVAMEVSGS